MKKLLSAVLALSVGVSCAAFTACGGSSEADAELAKKAINTLKVKYDKDSLYETTGEFTVIGQVSPDAGKVYSVSWSVESENNNEVKNYITFGEMDKETTLITASVTQPEKAIDYKLVASVKVGKVSESYKFSRKLKEKPATHTGTKEDPYTTLNVIEIANTMTPKTKLEESDNPQPVYVKGYIVDCGTDNPDNNRVGYVYIVNEYSTDKSKTSADAIMILSINYGEILKEYSDLKVGLEIMVKGYIMLYQKDANSTPQPEVTYYDKNGVTCEYLQQLNLSDDDKVDAAKKAINISTKYSALGNVDLPTSLNGASIAWAIDGTTDLVTITEADSKIKLNIVKLPEEATTIKLVATITCGEASDTLEITITVAPGAVTEHAGTLQDPLSVADVNKLFETLANNTIYKENGVEKQFFIEGYVTDKGEVNINSNNGTNYGLKDVYIADSETATKAESAWVYNINWGEAMPKGDGTNPLKTGDKIIVRGYLKNYNGENEIAQNTAKDYPVIVSINGETGGSTTPTPEGAVTVTMSEYAAANSWDVKGNVVYDTVNIDENVSVKLTVGKVSSYGQNTGKYYDNGKNWRIYQSEDPSITFTAVSGYKIVSIIITYEVDKTGVLVSADGATQYASGTSITVNAGTVTFGVGNTGSATNGQVRITAISVVYVAA